jgi:hypothetical protein
MKKWRTDIRAVTVCVDFDDFLRITLPRNLHHFREVWVVTTSQDARTQQYARSVPGVRLHVTDAFYRDGATFNKGLAIEEAFEAMGRKGWLMHLDADILLPRYVDWTFREIGHLYGPYRCVLEDVQSFQDGMSWEATVVHRESHRFSGYCQLFHATDPHLAQLPWYGVDWAHANGSDIEFGNRWPDRRRVRPDFKVLHLGPTSSNWCGRATDRLDKEPVLNQEENAKRMQQMQTDLEFRLLHITKERS